MRKLQAWTSVLCFAIGVGLIGRGLEMIYPPASFIAIGLLLACIGVALASAMKGKSK